MSDPGDERPEQGSEYPSSEHPPTVPRAGLPWEPGPGARPGGQESRDQEPAGSGDRDAWQSSALGDTRGPGGAGDSRDPAAGGFRDPGDPAATGGFWEPGRSGASWGAPGPSDPGDFWSTGGPAGAGGPGGARSGGYPPDTGRPGGYPGRPDAGDRPGYSGGYGSEPGAGAQPTFRARPDAGGQPGDRDPWASGGQGQNGPPGRGGQEGYPGERSYGGDPAYGDQGGPGSSGQQAGGFGSRPGRASQPGDSGQRGDGGQWSDGGQRGDSGQQGRGSDQGHGDQGPGNQGPGNQPGYRDEPARTVRRDPGERPGFPGQQGPGGQPGYGDRPGYGAQPGSGAQPNSGGEPGSGQPGEGEPRAYEGYATSRIYGAPRKQEAPAAAGGGRRRRRGPIIIITSVVAAVAVVIAVVIVVTRSGPSAPVKGFVPTGTSAQQDSEQIATAFLTAWQQRDYAKAASYTDNPAAAQAALAAYGAHLGLTHLTATYQGSAAAGAATPAGASPSASATATPAAPATAPGVPAASASAAQATPHQAVTFLMKDTVSAPYEGKPVSATWSYHSTMVTYQQLNSPGWYIAWRPDVVAPNLTATTHLATVTVPPTVQQVTDGTGQSLTRFGDAGLTNINGLLMKSAPANQGGTPGLDVEIQTAKGAAVPGTAGVLVNPGNIPTLATTISPQAESGARAAVAQHKGSAMVVIQPSTGDILAIANNAQSNDFALTANVAPGSTMKIITSASLFNSGTLTPTSGVECPKAYTIQGITYHNDQNETLPAGTAFSDDFAQSCNNAFTQQWPHLSGPNSLASTAKTYFGLNQDWAIGIPGASASYFNAPASASGSELAQEAFGEGQLTASPIAMASVAATVATGTFKQPILIARTKQVAATPLPAATDSDLKQVMRAVVTSGTANGLGLGPNVYAKTGTADIKGQQQPNSWFVAFDSSKDVAVACLVLNAGYGASVAGPEAAGFLKGY